MAFLRLLGAQARYSCLLVCVPCKGYGRFSQINGFSFLGLDLWNDTKYKYKVTRGTGGLITCNQRKSLFPIRIRSGSTPSTSCPEHTAGWFLFVSLFIFYLGRQHTHAAESNTEPSKQQDPENTKGIPRFL